MISTGDFVRDITFDNPEKDIPRNYPEISVMYHIFSGTDRDILANTDNDGNIKFSILCDNIEDAHSLKERLDNSYYHVYGSLYTINAKVRKSTVFISVSK